MTINPSVLVIDDLPQNVEVLGEYLSDTCEVQCAFSGPEGLALIEDNLPDLVLLDVMMPGMDGYEVCARLRADPRAREVPVIFVTAKNDAESESRALAAGAVDFIHKPINRDVVRARVHLQLALKARERELRDMNAELEQRVAERTQALREAMLQAATAHSAKSRFLANINHELRTPMNAILGLSDILARQSGDPAWRGWAAKIDEAGKQLLGLIDDIIDMSDMQAEKIAIEASDFELRELLDTALAPWRGRAKAKGLELALEIDPALPGRLRGDPARLRQILGNLLGNAIKFSETGRVILRAGLAGHEGGDPVARFEVEDHGIGVDAERRSAIFDIFEQADGSWTRRHGGGGLGLAICKQLVQLMGGAIGLSGAPGQGSVFWITVRLGKTATLDTGQQTPADNAAPAGETAPAVDWDQALQIIVPLTGLLTAGDIQAYMIWARAGTLLESLLGARSEAFDQAMRNFDFPAALTYLQAARAAHPQAATARNHGG